MGSYNMIDQIVKGIYSDIANSEVSLKPKHNTYTVVGCKCCHRFDKTLLKRDNEYICKDCLKGEK